MYTSYAMYVIWFADEAEYNAAVATCGGNGYGHSPYSAALLFGITWPLAGGGPMTGTKGIYGSMPYGIPGPPGPGFEVGHPAPSGVYLTSDVDYVDVPGQVGNPPQAGGQTMRLTWWGSIVYSPTEIAGAPPTVPIPQRRWITGFESYGYFSEGSEGYANSQVVSRVASRTGDGMGAPLRGGINGGAQFRLTEKYRPGLAPKSSWERFYIRINNIGTNEYTVWRADSNPYVNGQSVELRFNTSGTLLVYNGQVGSMTLIHTSTLTPTLGKWYLFDVLINFPALAGDSGRIRLYVNHVSQFDVSNNSGTGIDNLSYHERSGLGRLSTQDTLWSVDVDDWICADIPNDLGTESLNSLDWKYGSHVRAQYVKTGTTTGWTGNIASLNQFYSAQNPTNSWLTTTTALATIEAETEEIDEYGMPAAVIGPVAAWFGFSWFQSGGVNTSRVGYSIAGGAYVWNTITYGAENWFGILYAPTGLTVPTSITPVKYKYEHPNAGDSVTVKAGIAVIEYIGAWGQEDDPFLPMDLSNIVRLHNARYHNSIWCLPYTFAGVPDGPVFAVGGTYTGTGTSVTVNLPAPAHFVWIRALSGGALGAKIFGAGMTAGKGSTDENLNNYATRLWIDNTGQAKFTVAGTNAEINAIGVNYQYIAFCDPGTRFEYCGAFNYPDAKGSATIPLFDTDFLPEAGFIQKEILGGSSSTVYLSYKGPGFSANAGANMSGVLKSSWGTFATGALTVLSDSVITDRHQSNFALWRMVDPYGYVAVQVTSYTGDGTASQVVPFPITTGRWPLLAVVVPHNSTLAYMRDPSHTGTDSCTVNTLVNNVDAIIAGAADQITVGTVLNTVGIVYDVFVILGDDDGWNNGTFYPGSGNSTGNWTRPTFGGQGEPLIVMEGGMDFNGDAPYLLLENASGIYVLVPEKRNDTLYSKTDDTEVNVAIPDPLFKTGYIGG